jgi:hypothetical protein
MRCCHRNMTYRRLIQTTTAAGVLITSEIWRCEVCGQEKAEPVKWQVGIEGAALPAEPRGRNRLFGAGLSLN